MSDFKIVKLVDPISLGIDLTATGAYDNATAYSAGDSVSYNGSSYVAIQATTGNLPTDTTYWQLLASKGDTGADGADGLTVSVNSVTQVGGDISLTQDNIPDGATNKAYTATEQSKLAGIEASADVTDATNVAAAGAIMDGDFSTNGVMTRTGAGTYTNRTITGTTNQITVTNGDGVSGNPTLSLPQNIHTGASPTFAGATLAGHTAPSADSTYTLGTSSLYWSNTYTDRLYLNATAYLDGGTAGRTFINGQMYAIDGKSSGTGDYISHSLSTSASGTFTGNLFSLSIRPTTAVSISWLVGTKYNPVVSGTANLGAMKAFYAVPEHASTGTITEMIGAEIQPYITTATGAITTVRMLKLSQWGGGAGNGTIGTFYGLVIENPQKTVTGNSYGINIGSIPCSGTAYSLITNNGNIVFNEGGDANSDVRIEGDTDQNLLFTDASADMVGIGTNAPTSKLDINSDNVRIRTAKTPASATATGTQGQVCWDTSYIYVCTATNTWKRSALTTW